jgi:pyruvate kinase
VKCHYYDRFVSTDETVLDVNQIAKEKGYVKAGDSLVNLLAMPVANKGMVNTLRVSVIKD